MSIPLTINGATFEYPVVFDEDWGVNATGWAQAVTNGMLQRQGGSFPLLADVNFGASFGLIASYFTSRATNPATSGTLRLASADPGVAFRNNANSGNLVITTDASDNLLYNGHIISPSGASPVTSITGTANEIIASSATGNVILSTPQAIAATSSPTFAALTLTAPLTVANGGTGDAALTAYAVLTGGTTSTSPIQSIASVGTAGQVLTSNGAGTLPTFANPAAGSINPGVTPNIAYYATSSSILSDSGISRANLFLADGTVAATGAFNLNSHKITSLSTPTTAGDAVAYGHTFDVGSNKITGLANGTASTDAAAFGQIPVAGTAITKLTYYLNTSTGTLSATQILKFDTQVFDTLSEYSTSTGLFTPTVTGYYYISCNIDFEAANTTGGWLIEIYNNTGSTVLLTNTSTAVTFGDYQGNVSGLLLLTAATTYAIRLHYLGQQSAVRGNGGTAVNSTNLSIFRVP